jgi:hypothetical protein
VEETRVRDGRDVLGLMIVVKNSSPMTFTIIARKQTRIRIAKDTVNAE